MASLILCMLSYYEMVGMYRSTMEIREGLHPIPHRTYITATETIEHVGQPKSKGCAILHVITCAL